MLFFLLSFPIFCTHFAVLNEEQYLKMCTLAVHRWVVCNTAPDWWMNRQQCISVSGIYRLDRRTTNELCL